MHQAFYWTMWLSAPMVGVMIAASWMYGRHWSRPREALPVSSWFRRKSRYRHSSVPEQFDSTP